VQLRFQYTFDDYYRATAWNLNKKQNKFRRGLPRIAFTVFLILSTSVPFVLGVIPLLDFDTAPDRLGCLALGWLGSSLLWIFVILFIGLHRRRTQARTIWDGSGHLHKPFTVDITDEGVTFEQSDRRTDHRWSAFQDLEETPQLFLLYTSKLQYLIVPKRSFESPCDLAELYRLCREKLGGANREFHITPGPPPVQGEMKNMKIN
jgi:hypothetical protein